jgi:general secretion pathway protein F
MRFAVTAVDPANQVVALQLEAPDEVAVHDLARQRGFSVLSLQRTGPRFPVPFRTKQAFPATLFSIELLALLDAGLNVVEALQTLADKEPEGQSRRVLTDLLDALHRGESLSQAVGRFPEAFSALYAATIRSSERTGNIREALSRYIAYAEEFDRTRKKVRSALIYPAILVVVGTLVFGFLMFYVVPRFARVYEEISTELPLFSGLLLAVGRYIEHNGPVLLALFGAIVTGSAYLLSKEKNRALIVERLWRIPALGKRMRVYQLARFYHTVSMLLRAGIPALKAFEMVSELLPANLRAQLARAIGQLQEGQPMSAALTSCGLATPVATRMMAVGEKSGQMGELMDRIARFYDDETARFVDAFARVFEPLLMAVIGVAVGIVVVLMYMPIFELADSIR